MEQITREVLNTLEQDAAFSALDQSLKDLVMTQLARLSETDLLTGTANRMKLQGLLESEWARSVRYHSPISIIVFDVDKMKDINEEFGHDVGDEVLQTIARLISKNVRKTDVLGRWDGDEFMLVVPTTNNEQATWLAGKLQALIDETLFMSVGKVSCSFGVADRDAAMDIEDWMRIAEVALDAAKNDGGNTVVDYESIAHLDV